MWDHCAEITLHGQFYSIWLYPTVLAIHRLGLPRWCRPFAIGFLGHMNGLPFDLGGAAAGMWYFPSDSILLGTTVFPDAYAQFVYIPLAVGLLMECFCCKEPYVDQTFGYPKISIIKQVLVGIFGIVLGYLLMVESTLFLHRVVPLHIDFPYGEALAWLIVLVVCGLVFAYGLTRRTPPTCTEKDWIPLIAPILFLLSNLVHTVAALNGNRVMFEKPPKFNKSFTSDDYIISIIEQGIMFIIVSVTFTWVFTTVNPSTYKLMV